MIPERISKARLRLLYGVPFLGSLVARLNIIVVEDEKVVPTACIHPTGRLHINKGFAESLSDPELAFILAHEVLHVALAYWSRKGSRNAVLLDSNGGMHSAWNCFPAGTLVGGAWENIECMGAGEEVLTRSGRQKAQEWMERPYKGDLYTIKALGLESFSCTDEHPLLVVPRLNKRYPIRLGDPEFIPASGCLEKYHYLCIPRIKGTDSSVEMDLTPFTKMGRWGEGDLAHNARIQSFPLNEDTAWMMGLYVAEGDIHGERVRWTLHEKETALAERVQRICASLGYSVCQQPVPDRHGLRVVLGSTLIARLFLKHFCTGSHNKRIADFILYHKDENLMRAFLEGYHAGDGWTCGYRGEGKGAGTASHVLALQLQLAWARLGKLAKIYKTPQKDRWIRDTFIQGGQAFWRLDVHEGISTTREMNGREIQSCSHRWKCTPDFILVPIIGISVRSWEGLVYNMGTPDHTYTVSNAVVHNCAHDYAINLILRDFSKTGAGKWLSAPEKILLDDKYENWSAERIYDDILASTPSIDGFFGDVGSGPPLGEGTEEQKRWEQYLHKAMEDHRQRRAGGLPDVLTKYIENLIPKVSWAEKLAQWTGDNYAGVSYNYRRPSRREGASNCVLAAADHNNAPDVIILWDTSGSMVEYVGMVFTELEGIIGALRAPVRVVLCDTQVQGDFCSLREAQELAGKVQGGGGSDFNPAFDVITRPDSLILAFTDGAIDVPSEAPRNNTLWVLTPKGQDPTGGQWGDTLFLPGE